MSATPKSRGKPAASREVRHGKRRRGVWPGGRALGRRELDQHDKLLQSGARMSGRSGAFVYYWAYGRQCWRRQVIPKDPRTPVQQVSRAVFGKASIAWSKDPLLGEAQRAEWRAAAAKMRSRPRMAQSGRLTGQLYFVGRNAVKERWGLPLLTTLESRLSSTTTEPELPASRPRVGASSRAYPRASAPTNRACGRRLSAQRQLFQHLTQPSSEWLRISSLPVPERCRWGTHASRGLGHGWSTLSRVRVTRCRRTPRLRPLWRGG